MEPRRSFLKKTIGASTVAAASLIAGCGNQENDGDGSNPGGGDGGTEVNLDNYTQVQFTDPGIPSPNRSSDSLWVESGLFAVRSMEEIGIQANMNTMEISAFVDYYLASDSNDYKITTNSRRGTPDRIDPKEHLLHIYHSDSAGEGSIENNADYRNPHMDTLIEEANSELDTNKRKDLVFRAQEIAAQDIPHYPLAVRNSLLAYNSNQWQNWKPWLGNNGLGNPLALSTAESVDGAETIVKAVAWDIPNLNWVTSQSENVANELLLIYDRLVQLGFDGQPQPRLAENWEAIDDTTWEVTIRGDQTWHDGEPVTAEDVKFSHDYAKEHPSSRAAIVLDAVDNIEVVDDVTTRWNLAEPDPAFVNVTLARQPLIVPKHIWEDVSNPTEATIPGDVPMIGSGPMKFVSFEAPSRVEYEVNENHFWDYDFKKMITRRYGGIGTAVAAVETGEADFVQRINPTEYERLQDIDNIQRETGITMGIYGIMMRCDSRPTNDVWLRRAIAHSIDTEDLVNVVFQGFGARPGESTYFPKENEFWHNPNRREYKGGAEKARTVLEQASYVWNDDGMLMQPNEMPDICSVGCYTDEDIDGWDGYEGDAPERTPPSDHSS